MTKNVFGAEILMLTMKLVWRIFTLVAQMSHKTVTKGQILFDDEKLHLFTQLVNAASC